jgi:hypothetical protein
METLGVPKNPAIPHIDCSPHPHRKTEPGYPTDHPAAVMDRATMQKRKARKISCKIRGIEINAAFTLFVALSALGR